MHLREAYSTSLERRLLLRFVCGSALLCVALSPVVRAEIGAAPPLEPVEGITPENQEDEARLRGIHFALLDWEDAASKVSRHGLEVEVALVPDLLAARAGAAYLAARREGLSHELAVAQVGKSWDDWKRFDGVPAFRFHLSNPGHVRPRERRRIFTLEKNLARDGVLLRDARGRRLRTELAERPAGLAVRELRVKKFWRTKDGATRRAPPKKGPDADNPAALGREPIISKPFRAALVESDPVGYDLLISPRDAGRSEAFTVTLEHWKRYEGPFAEDLLDLNEDRAWDEIEAIQFRVDPPAGRLEVRPQLRALVGELRTRAEASAKKRS